MTHSSHALMIGFTAAVILLQVNAAANAEPVYFAAHAEALVAARSIFHPDTRDSIDTGFIEGADSLGPFTVEAISGKAVASGIVEIRNGELKARASAFAPDGGFVDAADASAKAEFIDTFLLVSNSLPMGAPVDLAFALDVTFALTNSACIDSNAYLGAQLGTTTPGLHLRYDEDTCTGIIEDRRSGVFRAAIGEEFGVQTTLQVRGATSSVVAESDAYNTLRFRVEPLGDFSYVTASGNSYVGPQPTAIPEPATLLLLGSGMMGAAHRKWRRL